MSKEQQALARSRNNPYVWGKELSPLGHMILFHDLREPPQEPEVVREVRLSDVMLAREKLETRKAELEKKIEERTIESDPTAELAYLNGGIADLNSYLGKPGNVALIQAAQVQPVIAEGSNVRQLPLQRERVVNNADLEQVS